LTRILCFINGVFAQRLWASKTEQRSTAQGPPKLCYATKFKFDGIRVTGSDSH